MYFVDNPLWHVYLYGLICRLIHKKLCACEASG